MSYPTLTDIQTGTWGAILVIDPNGIRPFSPQGPIYYKLDTLRIQPGLTDRSGTFVGTLNDNKNDVRPYDMTLLTPESTYLRENDEFWVGVQYGPSAEGLLNTWDGSTGRYWFMGGWINRLYYRYSENGEITAVIEGKDYMDLWRTQPYGVPDDPKDYSETGIDFTNLVSDLLTQVNTLQTEADYRFSQHPTYWVIPTATPSTINLFPAMTSLLVASAANLTTGHAVVWDDNTVGDERVYIESIVPFGAVFRINLRDELTGTYLIADNARIVMETTRLQRNIRSEMIFDLMADACHEVGYDWQIVPDPTGATPAECRRVMFYPRDSDAPKVNLPSRRIAYDRQIREIPVIQLGDNEDIATNILVVTEKQTVPDNISNFMQPGLWPDKDEGSYKFSPLSVPLPRNAEAEDTAIFGDVSLIQDDDGYPAICFTRYRTVEYPTEDNNLYWNFLQFYTRSDGRPAGANLDLDLRKWRRLKFKFRHPTYSSDGELDELTYYKVRIHTNLEDSTGDVSDWYKRAYVYEFNSDGEQQRLQIGSDMVSGQRWTLIDLLLPELDEDGVVVNWNGWMPEYTENTDYDIVTADPLHIDFVSFEIYCSEFLYRDLNDSYYVDIKNNGGFIGRSIGLGDSQVMPNTGDYYIASEYDYAETFYTYFYIGALTYDLGKNHELTFTEPIPLVLWGNGVKIWEWVYVEAINGDWGVDANGDDYLIRLRTPVVNDYSTASSVSLLVPVGTVWCISQLRFEKGGGYNIPVERTTLTKPYRYRLVEAPEVEVKEEAVIRAAEETFESTEYAQIKVDGNPYYLMGYIVNPQLDPNRETLFHNVWHMLDDITYVVDGTDFYCDLTIGPLGVRAKRIVDLVEYQARQSRKLNLIPMQYRDESYRRGYTG